MAVARELEPHFPSRFRLSAGIVVNSLGEESRQQDVLVTDPGIGTPFVAEGNIGVHPIETIAATLQVKTTISTSTIPEAVENVASVKRLLPDEPRSFSRLSQGSLAFGQAIMKPFAGIIAFNATSSHESIRRAYLQANASLAPANRTNALFVLDQFATLWSPDGTPMSITESPVGTTHSQTFLAGRDSILFFYIVLMRALNTYQPPTLDLVAYLNARMPIVTVFHDRLTEEPQT